MIKSRKQILEESNEELSRIRKNLKIQEKYPENEWYSEMGIGFFEPIIKRRNIKKSEVLEKVKICEMIDKKNKIYPKVDKITKSPKLYSELIESAAPLKSNKSLYSWYMELLKQDVYSVVIDYNMDQLMVLDYLIKNKKRPEMSSPRESVIMGIASYYYTANKYKKSGSHWLIRLVRALMMGV